MRKNLIIVIGFCLVFVSSFYQPTNAGAPPSLQSIPAAGLETGDSGVEIVDQSQEGTDYGFTVTEMYSRWQEFIPTLYNITAVELFMIKSGTDLGTLIVEIQENDGTMLRHVEIDHTNVPTYGWLKIPFTQLNINPGTKYRIVLSINTTASPDNAIDYIGWRGNTASTYCLQCDNDVTGSWPDYDYAFRTYGVGIFRPTAADFDGDRSSDISVYRPSNGNWYIPGQSPVSWGLPGDLPVPGNYHTGCGVAATDIAIYRPSNGKWYIKGSFPISWGLPGDIPVQADYSGDGETDMAVLRPSNGNWYVRGLGHFSWYQSGDIPVPCDYNGDFTDDIAVYRPSNGKWYIRGQGSYQWGQSGDIPVPADYDGDGSCDIAVYRPSNGKWYIWGQSPISWGIPDDIPVPGDYDGCGDAEIAVLRPSTGRWYIRGVGNFSWYQSGDFPLPVRDTNADGDPHQ